MTEESQVPGSVRPGGRTARVRAAVLDAAGDLLAENGFARLDLAEVAARAEVGKTTVYRRWRTPPGSSPICWSTWPKRPSRVPTPVLWSAI